MTRNGRFKYHPAVGVSRTILLALSENPWLRAQAPRWWFVKKAATRFMPGDTLDDALTTARALHAQGIGVVLTQLGENVTDAAGAGEVVEHYLDVLAKIRQGRLDCHLSVKLTQLGLDVDLERCHANVRRLVEAGGRQGTYVWIDMEQHAYVDRTLAIYRRLASEFPTVGVCLQAYLYRTMEDLRSLLPLGGGIRLVKGAYRELSNIAYPNKRDVDASFLELVREMIAARPAPVPRMVFGTHDGRMLDAIRRQAERERLPRDAFEFHLLFGIQRAQQIRLARDGYRVRVLISYGDQWFAWYMRRLAERPANVLFALRAMFS
jgi:proline dehydrogenase